METQNIHTHKQDGIHKSKLLLLFVPILVFGIILIYFALRSPDAQLSTSLTSLPTSTPMPTVQINDTTIPVAIAADHESRRIGLSNHSSLPDNEGMLFVFEDQDIPASFWMLGMEFPIDIIWINDGQIVQIHRDAQPQPEDIDYSEIVYYIPDETIDYVLEVNAGFTEANNINPGDSVIIQR